MVWATYSRAEVEAQSTRTARDWLRSGPEVAARQEGELVTTPNELLSQYRDRLLRAAVQGRRARLHQGRHHNNPRGNQPIWWELSLQAVDSLVPLHPARPRLDLGLLAYDWAPVSSSRLIRSYVA